MLYGGPKLSSNPPGVLKIKKGWEEERISVEQKL